MRQIAGVLESSSAAARTASKTCLRRPRALAAGEIRDSDSSTTADAIKVRSDRDVPENMVFMPFCYAEAAANLLTNPALDPFGKIPEFKFCAVRAERAEIRTAAE